MFREHSRSIKVAVGLLFCTVLIGVVVWMIVTQPLLGRGETLNIPSVDEARLRTHVDFLSVEILPRDWSHPDNLDRGAEYIRSQFRTAGGSVSDQSYLMDGQTYRNVVVSFGPSARDRVIVGAHYDAYGELPGADDNASGVAGLIELAGLLGDIRLERRVDLVAFGLEEPKTIDGDGLFRGEYGGSAVYVRSLLEQETDVRAFLNLEMIGYFSSNAGSQSFPIGLLNWFYPSEGNFIAIIGRIGQGRVLRQVKRAMRGAADLPVYSMSAHEAIEGVGWSDHVNFWNAGYDAVMITDTSFLRNMAYHTERDTADRLDYDLMAMVVKGVYAAVVELSR